MLTGLSIRDVVLIETLDLEFGAGLGVLTGETGAGKSILLDALGLALGARADSGLVRDGQPQAVVSVSFELPTAIPPCACSPTTASTAKPANRSSSAASSRPTAAAGPSSTTSRRRSPCCAISARCWSRSTASTTIAACSTRAATALLLDAFGRIDTRAGRRCLAPDARRRRRARRGARRTRQRRARPRMARPCGRRTARARARAGRGRGAGGAAREHAEGRAAGGRTAARSTSISQGSDGGAGPAAPGGAAARPDRDRA